VSAPPARVNNSRAAAQQSAVGPCGLQALGRVPMICVDTRKAAEPACSSQLIPGCELCCACCSLHCTADHVA
jgi:hypothetical protein